MIQGAKPFDRQKVTPFLRRFCPDYMAERIADLDPADLVALGIRGVLLDLDNTLLPWKSSEMPETTIAWVGDCLDAGLKVCLVSNTRNLTRLKEMADLMGIPAVAPTRMKPSRSGFRRALEILDLKPAETIMIGDQMFTDVWGGNRSGIRTVWVDRVAEREFFGTKISRMAERLLSRWIRKGQGT